jgi:hypothetical protein
MSNSKSISHREAFRGLAMKLGLALTLAGVLGGCASIRSVPDQSDNANKPIYEVSITRTVLIPGTPEKVFAFIAAEDVLPKVLTGYGPLPAVTRTSENTGPWDKPGSARVVHLADGTSAREQVTRYSSPKDFAYRVWDFGNPVVKTLATEARGEWRFTPTGDSTQVEWTYTFVAKNAAAALPLSGITQLLWRGYMDVCLDNTAKLLAR